MQSGLDTGQPVRPSAGRSTQKGNWLNLGNPQQPQKLKAPGLVACGSLHVANLRDVTVALKFYSDGKWLGIWIFNFCVLSTLVLSLSLAHQISVGFGLARAVTEQGSLPWSLHVAFLISLLKGCPGHAAPALWCLCLWSQQKNDPVRAVWGHSSTSDKLGGWDGVWVGLQGWDRGLVSDTPAKLLTCFSWNPTLTRATGSCPGFTLSGAIHVSHLSSHHHPRNNEDGWVNHWPAGPGAWAHRAAERPCKATEGLHSSRPSFRSSK